MTGRSGVRMIAVAGEELRTWINIKSDLRFLPDPPLRPETVIPVFPDELESILARGLLDHELSQESRIRIPEPILEVYRKFRPTPLIYARKLKEALDTPAHIYFKLENNPGGSLFLSALAQAYYSKLDGAKRIVSESSSGLWGIALSVAGTIFDLEVKVYIPKITIERNPLLPVKMRVFGAHAEKSPSTFTKPGRDILRENPKCLGSLGIAMSEALWDSYGRSDTKYAPLFWADYQFLHSTFSGLEALQQLEQFGVLPDVIIGPASSESSFPGLVAPFVLEWLNGSKDMKFVAVETKAFPVLSEGIFSYDFADYAGLSPLFRMFTFGHSATPPPLYLTSFRHHAASPLMSLLKRTGVLETVSYGEKETLEAALFFAKCEGILPTPDSALAVKAAIEEALKAKKEGVEKVVLFVIDSCEDLDMRTYDIMLKGAIEEHEFPAEEVGNALRDLPELRARGDKIPR